MATTSNPIDRWLEDSGATALVLREHLQSVDGPDGVLFPATYAASEDRTFRGGYNIDEFPDGTNVCLVDSVGSQANRMEPIFLQPGYAELVPQIVIVAGDHRVNLLEAGHRAGDAIARCSELQQELNDAFKAASRGDMEPLARIAPTSLVFGVWDSRDTQVKIPRLVASTIRAYNVKRLTRSAQYVPPVNYVESGLLPEPTDRKAKDLYSERGFIHVPASGTHGGVIATGGVRRDVILHLAGLRLLTATTPDRTRALQRYVLGLAMVVVTHPAPTYLRQGCHLTLVPGRPRECDAVYPDGRREPFDVSHDVALQYARQAAETFGVGPSREVTFDPRRAQSELDEAATGKKRKKTGTT